MDAKTLDYTCIGGPLHGKRWYYEGSTYFQVPLKKQLMHPAMSVETLSIDEVAFEVSRYRLERFGTHRVWIPYDVQDPEKFVLELALKAPA